MARVLLVAARIHTAHIHDCKKYRATESGGVLVGVQHGEVIKALFSIPAGPRAKRSRVEFSPDSAWQQTFLDYLHERFPTFDYLGDWHRHPGRFDRPSAHDLRTAREIVTTWGKPEAVFPIAVIDGDCVRFRAYLMRRETLQFEEIPIEVVPDTDPRMMAALTGMDAQQKEQIHAAENSARRQPRGHRSRRFLRRAAAYLRHLSTR